MAKKGEQVKVWDIGGNAFADARPMARKTFYDEQLARAQAGQEPNKRVEIAVAFIVDVRNGAVFISRRSDQKQFNPGLFDKTVGGHQQNGMSSDFTITIECLQELCVPSFVPPRSEFIEFFKAYRSHLGVAAVMRHVDDIDVALTKRLRVGSGLIDVPIANRIHLYFGAYAGPTQTVDQEAMGVLRYTLADLRREMERAPHLFTSEMAFWIEKYGGILEQFIETVRDK